MGQCGDRSKRRKKVTDLVLKNTQNGTISLLAVDGVFVAIGLIPNICVEFCLWMSGGT